MGVLCRSSVTLLTRGNETAANVNHFAGSMLISLRAADHYADARQREESLRIEPCNVVENQDELHLPEGARSLGGLILPMLKPSPEEVPSFMALFGSVQHLHHQQEMLLERVMRSAAKERTNENNHEKQVDSEDGSSRDERSEDDEPCVIDKLIQRDQNPKLVLRKLEQRIQIDPHPSVGANSLLRESLGQHQPPEPWPSEVHATRERFFRPHLTQIHPAQTHPEQLQAPKAPRMRCLGGLRGLTRRLCHSTCRYRLQPHSESGEHPAQHSSALAAPPAVMLGMECAIMPHGSAAEARESSLTIAHGFELLLHSTSADATNNVFLPPDTAKALAPLGSARQRSERAQKLLASAMTPMCTVAAAPSALFPRCLRLQQATPVLREMQRTVQADEATAPPTVRSSCVIRRFLSSRTPKEPAGGHPLCGIARDLLMAHESSTFKHFLERGDLSAKARMLPQVKDATNAADLAATLAMPLLSDPIIGGLITQHRMKIGSAPGKTEPLSSDGADLMALGGAKSGPRSAGLSVAETFGLLRADLVGYRRALAPNATAIAAAPPSELSAHLSHQTAPMRIALGYESMSMKHAKNETATGASIEGGGRLEVVNYGDQDVSFVLGGGGISERCEQGERLPDKQSNPESGAAAAASPKPSSKQESDDLDGRAVTMGLKRRLDHPENATTSQERIKEARKGSPTTTGQRQHFASCVFARGRRTTADDALELAGAYTMSLCESFEDSVDAFLQISHGVRPDQRHQSGGDRNPSRGRADGASNSHLDAPQVLGEPLQSKLLRHAKGSTGLLALLPECLCEHIPLIAAQIIATATSTPAPLEGSTTSAEPHGVLWALPEPMVGSAHAFWEEFLRSAAHQPGVRAPPLITRTLEATPGSCHGAPPLRAGEVAFCSLHSLATAATENVGNADMREGRSDDPTVPHIASLIVVTANSPELTTCEAIGRYLGSTPRSRVVALLCGIPHGGSAGLTPLCIALGVHRLLICGEHDPDVRALCATQRTVHFTLPSRLQLSFEGLATDAQAELQKLLEARPDLAPLPFESRAIKHRIEQTSAARKPGGTVAPGPEGGGQRGSHGASTGSGVGDADQRLFWSLMACFCARRLLDCAEDADAASFRAFIEQVVCQKHSKLAQTFARREALKTVRARRRRRCHISAPHVRYPTPLTYSTASMVSTHPSLPCLSAFIHPPHATGARTARGACQCHRGFRRIQACCTHGRSSLSSTQWLLAIQSTSERCETLHNCDASTYALLRVPTHSGSSDQRVQALVDSLNIHRARCRQPCAQSTSARVGRRGDGAAHYEPRAADRDRWSWNEWRG